MCRDCWEDYGSPAHTSPDIARAVTLLQHIDRYEVVGLPLHVEIDDWNIGGTWQVYEDCELQEESSWAVARELATLMNRLPVADRAAAMARADGFVIT